MALDIMPYIVVALDSYGPCGDIALPGRVCLANVVQGVCADAVASSVHAFCYRHAPVRQSERYVVMAYGLYSYGPI